MTDSKLIEAMDHCLFIDDCNGCPLACLNTTSECLEQICKSAMELINKQKLEIEKLTRSRKDITIEFADEVITQISRNHTISADWMRNYLYKKSRGIYES